MDDNAALVEDAQSAIMKIESLLTSITNNDAISTNKAVRGKLRELVAECRAQKITKETKAENPDLLLSLIHI